jgi:fatty acid desaturase
MATDLQPIEKTSKKARQSRRDRRSKNSGQRKNNAQHKNTAQRKNTAQGPGKPAAEQKRWAQGYDWPVLVWIAVIHGTALAAPFVFSWQGLVACLFLAWLTGSIGVCMGYHRQLTHGSFSTYRPIRWLLALIGGLSGEGSALTWVANHRKHHLHSDKEGVPALAHHHGPDVVCDRLFRLG